MRQRLLAALARNRSPARIACGGASLGSLTRTLALPALTAEAVARGPARYYRARAHIASRACAAAVAHKKCVANRRIGKAVGPGVAPPFGGPLATARQAAFFCGGGATLPQLFGLRPNPCGMCAPGPASRGRSPSALSAVPLCPLRVLPRRFALLAALALCARFALRGLASSLALALPALCCGLPSLRFGRPCSVWARPWAWLLGRLPLGPPAARRWARLAPPRAARGPLARFLSASRPGAFLVPRSLLRPSSLGSPLRPSRPRRPRWGLRGSAGPIWAGCGPHRCAAAPPGSVVPVRPVSPAARPL